MKHIQLFEQFANILTEKKMLKKDLKNLADEISAQIPNLPAFKKFKQGSAKSDVNDRLLVDYIPDTPKLSSIGTFKRKYMKLNRNQESFTAFFDDEGNQLFRLVYVISRKSRGMYDSSSQLVDHFQIIIGDNYNSISPAIEMILPHAGYHKELGQYKFDEVAAVAQFKDEFNKALNSPKFVELIKQYSTALNTFNIQG